MNIYGVFEETYEFTERELLAFSHENTGKPYSKINYVKDLVMEARINAALKKEEK